MAPEKTDPQPGTRNPQPVTRNPQPGTSNPEPVTEKKPWPLSWILIIILVYIALQTAYFLFFAE